MTIAGEVLGYYETRIEEYTENGEDFFKIHFTRNKDRYNRGLVVGTLYVQAKGYKVLGFEGRMHARHNGLRAFDDSQPCLIVDAGEAGNITFDAGISSYARYLVADYGPDYPFVQDPGWRESTPTKNTQYSNIESRFGITPTDYRRTLYWNPNVKVDGNGEAVIRFYNCSRQTEPSADAQGQAANGTLLWNE